MEIIGNNIQPQFITEDGRYIPVMNIPDDYSDLKCGVGYIIGDYIYQYYGNISRYTKDYLNIPGSIVKVGNEYIMKNFEEASEGKRRFYSASNLYMGNEEKQSSESIINEYIDNYKKGNNLIIGNEVKLTNTGDLYIPELKEEDDALTRIMKLMIIHKKVVLSNYANKMDKEYSLDNLRSALNGATINMAVTKFLQWCKLLDLEWKFELFDNGTDNMNPLLENLFISNDSDLWVDVMDNSNTFQVPCVEGEDPLKRLIKVAIIKKQIVLSEYKDRGTTPHLINNMRSALKRSSKMMFPYFVYWCEVLGVDFRFTLIDPIDGHTEIAGVDYRNSDYMGQN